MNGEEERTEVLVVRVNEAEVPQFSVEGLGVPGGSTGDIELHHIVYDEQSPLWLEMEIELALLNNPGIVVVYFVFNGDDCELRQWVETRPTSFLMYLGVCTQTSDDWHCGTLDPDYIDDDADGNPADAAYLN